MATHSSSTCLALYCTGRLSSSVLTWYDWSEPRLCELFDVVRISLQLCHRWNAYWTKQLAHGDWLLCWLCRYIGCWFAGGGPRWSRWLHRRHPTSWPWAATRWWASCLMSMHLVMVVQNWLGSPGPGSVGWRPIRQTREERETSAESNNKKIEKQKNRNKRSPHISVLCGISNPTVFFQSCGIAVFQLWQSHPTGGTSLRHGTTTCPVDLRWFLQCWHQQEPERSCQKSWYGRICRMNAGALGAWHRLQGNRESTPWVHDPHGIPNWFRFRCFRALHVDKDGRHSWLLELNVCRLAAFYRPADSVVPSFFVTLSYFFHLCFLSWQ